MCSEELKNQTFQTFTNPNQSSVLCFILFLLKRQKLSFGGIEVLTFREYLKPALRAGVLSDSFIYHIKNQESQLELFRFL